jgi:molybdate transport system substrate-binding protein
MKPLKQAAVAVSAALLFAGSAMAAELKMLSAGALEPAVRVAAADFQHRTGNTVNLDFATATVIRERGAAPLTVELVAGPDPLMEDLAGAGRVVAKPAALGRVGVGVTVRNGAPPRTSPPPRP